MTPLEAVTAALMTAQQLSIRLLIPGMGFDPADPWARPLGGSETAGIQLAQALARLGHKVEAYANVEAPWHASALSFAPLAGFHQAHGEADLAIVQRAASAFGQPIAARARFLWVHDQLDQRRHAQLVAAAPHLDRIVTVSRYQLEHYRQVEPSLPGELFLQLRNGIDLDLIDQERKAAGPRLRHQVVCGARPERGLAVLLEQVFPQLLRRVPDATLVLASYVAADGSTEQLRELAARFGDRVRWAGALGKPELYRLYAESGLYLYPTPSPTFPTFAETSCISAMEAMACGLPVVTTVGGALPETVGDGGICVELAGPHAAAGATPNRLVRAAARLLDDHVAWGEASAAGLRRAAHLGWDEVAATTIAAAYAVIAERVAGQIRPSRRAPKPKLLIAVPAYDAKVHVALATCLASAAVDLAGRGIETVLRFHVSTHLPQARNLFVREALLGDYTHLLMSDADMAWPPDAPWQLLSRGVDVVAGCYQRRADGAFVLADARPVDGAEWLLETGMAGTGLILFARSALEALSKAFPAGPFQFAYSKDGRFLAEDYVCLQRWRSLGGRIHVDASFRVAHFAERALDTMLHEALEQAEAAGTMLHEALEQAEAADTMLHEALEQAEAAGTELRTIENTFSKPQATGGLPQEIIDAAC